MVELDWSRKQVLGGMGMARQSDKEAKEQFFGEVPGYPEGATFLNRYELSQSRVHRPLMAGICGSGLSGAESIVLSGGYEDDEDYGDVVIYTGHGGNDLETKKQVRDQELTRGNLALAHNSLAGIPVRVIRGHRHRSPFAPKTGFRYDGLYRVEDYWCERGKSGFLIWRFRLVKLSSAGREQGEGDAVNESREPYRAISGGTRDRIVTRVIRDTATTLQVKRLHDSTCQICGVRLETDAGAYAEALHLRPLEPPHNGPDTPENVLCLCPNHRVLVEHGALTIEDDLFVPAAGTRLRTAKGHTIGQEYVRYRREHYRRNAEPVRLEPPAENDDDLLYEDPELLED
ncbi:MAG: YDG/SRA domain-containing protein [Chloroherpetonaceae bacterium]|nr:hypothetical protein [Chthonomonadaceae bacterium]MDW8209093.1 YDG/SRA domain-containing protein [Chloroherpetonaceae bacterium]